MPDFAVCNSTVCTVRKNCSRSWDSGLRSDRDPKEQEWVTFHSRFRQPGPEPLRDAPVTHHDDCPQYLPITPDFPPDYIPMRCWESDRRYHYRHNHSREGKINYVKMTPSERGAFEDGMRFALSQD